MAKKLAGQERPYSSEMKRYQVRFCRFVKISVDDRAQDLLDRFSVEASVQDPCVRLSGLSVQGVCRRSPKEVFVRDLKE